MRAPPPLLCLTAAPDKGQRTTFYSTPHPTTHIPTATHIQNSPPRTVHGDGEADEAEASAQFQHPFAGRARPVVRVLHVLGQHDRGIPEGKAVAETVANRFAQPDLLSVDYGYQKNGGGEGGGRGVRVRVGLGDR